MNLAASLGLGIVVFASTNVDDIFVLLGFLVDPRFRLRYVAIGQYLGIGALVAASMAASLVSLVLPAAYVGLLGIFPVLIGAVRLASLWRGEGLDTLRRTEKPRAGSLGQIAPVAAVTIANGGDNIGVYTPLFATQSIAATLVILIVFAIMTILWVGLAHRLVNHPKTGAPLRRYGRVAVPFILIGLGLLILRHSGASDLLRLSLFRDG